MSEAKYARRTCKASDTEHAQMTPTCKTGFNRGGSQSGPVPLVARATGASCAIVARAGGAHGLVLAARADRESSDLVARAN